MEPDVQQHRTLWELAGALLSIAGTDGYFRQVSPSWERTLGWTAEELTSRPFVEFVHPDDVERTLTELGTLRAPGHAVHGFTNRYRTSDGSYRWLSWNARSDEHGDLIYSVALDVTERESAQRQRELAERRFQLAIEGAPTGVALVDTDGRWITVNDAYADLVGYTADELTAGITFQDITHPDDLDIDVQHVEDMLAGRIDKYSMEKRYIRKDGNLIWVLLSVRLLRDSDGEPSVFIAQAVDITPRKEHERHLARLISQLQDSQADAERFASAASHDLTSPLGIIAMYLDSMAEHDLDDELRDMVQRARGLAYRSVDMVRGMLRFASAGTNAVGAVRVDTDRAVSEALELLEAPISSHPPMITIGPLPQVIGDHDAVTSLFQNLIGNALKYAGPQARIDIHARLDGDEVILTVDDDGPGIPRQDRERMFEPFTRGGGPSNTAGAGLGLATCQRIAERLGGDIRASESPLGGLRIEVQLPAAYHVRDGYVTASEG